MSHHEADRAAAVRLSPLQGRIWACAADGAVAVSQVAVRLPPGTSPDRLRAALDNLARRHQALRARLRARGPRSAPALSWDGPPAVLTTAPPSAELPAVLRAERVRRVDPGEGPMLRAVWCPVGDGAAVGLTAPALVADALAMARLAEDLAADLAAGAPPVEAVQLDQVLAWHEDLPRGPEAAEAQAFWQRVLDRVETDPALPWPGDPEAAADLVTVPVPLAAEVAGALAARPDAEAALITLWAVLLWRLTGAEPVPVAHVGAGRPFAELATAVAPMARTVPLPVSLQPDFTLAEACTRVAEALAEAEAWLDWFPPAEGRADRPWPGMAFPVESVRLSAAAASGILPGTLRSHGESVTARLWAEWRGEDLALRLDVDPRRVGLDHARRLAGYLAVLLADGLARPAARLDTLDLLGAPVRRVLLDAAGASSLDAVDAPLVPDAIAATIAARPDAVAVTCEGRQVSYGALGRLAEGLAGRLFARGAGPEQLVAVYLERSPETVAAILAAWRVGAAYLPLDPDDPAERVAGVVREARPVAVLTSRALRRRLRECDAPVLVIEDAADARPAPAVRRDPRHLAYAIYTSASSGAPKGVLVEHRQLARYCAAVTERLALPAGGRYALLTTFAADLGHTMVFPALAGGGRLAIVPRMRALDARGLARTLAAEMTDVMKLVPAHLAALLSGVEPSALMPGRCLILGGDAADPGLIARLGAAAPRVPIVNHYGPSETTVGVLTGPVDLTEIAPPDLGRALRGTTAHVLDHCSQPAPPEVPGELHLGGGTLARGYLSRPAETADRFRPDPFARVIGARLYRTGDRALRRPGGAIAFRGRLDEQVQVRGHRVEPEEIAAALRRHPAVEAAAVTVQAEPNEAPRLLAYVTVPRAHLDAERRTLLADWITDWQSVFAEAHADLPRDADEPFTACGWSSSYSGEPLPDTEVREQAQRAAARVLDGAPRRVLEIGCGTGLLLFALAEHVDAYVGTDFSAPILAYTRRMVARSPWAARVRLLERPAHAFDGLDPGTFDVVVLNSLVQYFPDTDYLLDVLRQALRCLRPGGRLFVGDVRALALQHAFHTAVQLHRSADGSSTRALTHRIRQRLERDSELLLDPAFFHGPVAALPGVAAVATMAKRGRAWNELTQFRFDAVVYRETPTETTPAAWHAWTEEGWSLARLRAWLTAERPTGVALAGVPNARVAAACRATALLGAGPALRSVADLRRALTADGRVEAVDPEDVWQLGAELGYAVHVALANHAPDALDVVLARCGDGARAADWLVLPPPDPGPARGLSSAPLLTQVGRTLIPQLRAHLASSVPDFMMPEAIQILPALPLGPNGKINRAALPVPAPFRPELERQYVAPRGAVERVIATVWADVLRLDRVGIADDFFALGGHSLLATQVVARLQEIFQVAIPLASFLEVPPTVADAARLLHRHEGEAGRTERIAAIWERVQAMSAEDVDAALQVAPEPPRAGAG